ncbi:MAG: hypothetical protein ACP5KX_08030 [Caldisericia bacterium]
MHDLENLSKDIERMKSRYLKYLREKEKARKRRQDVLLTLKDKEILIESFVIASLIENFISKTISKLI